MTIDFFFCGRTISSADGGSSPLCNIASVFLNLLEMPSFISDNWISTSSTLSKVLWQALQRFYNITRLFWFQNILASRLTGVGTSASCRTFPIIVPRHLLRDWLPAAATWNIFVQERAEDPTRLPQRKHQSVPGTVAVLSLSICSIAKKKWQLINLN